MNSVQKQEKIVYLHRPHNVLSHLPPPSEPFPCSFSLNSLQISSSGSQDRFSPADLCWFFGAIVCWKPVIAHAFPRASATMKCWLLSHSGENVHLSANWEEKCPLGEGSSLSHLGHMKVSFLLVIFDPQCRDIMFTWIRTQQVQPLQHRPEAVSDKGNVHFDMTVLVYEQYWYFSSKRPSVPSSTQLLLTATYFTGSWGQKGHQMITTLTRTQFRVSNEMWMCLDEIPGKHNPAGGFEDSRVEFN